MKRLFLISGLYVAAALPLAISSPAASAGDLDCLRFLKGTPLDVHRPEADKQCGREGCVERVPVNDCVTGEKKVYKPSIHCEYVSIPEVRYRLQTKCITKEIPWCYCKPVCKTIDVDHPYEAERWDKRCLGCAELHCKGCEPKCEKLTCKECGAEPGKTTVKLEYWSCVKVPYTVYRQVAKEVCVKQPRYEKVDVPITRYICKQCREDCRFCGGKGCQHCRQEACAGSPTGVGKDVGRQNGVPEPPGGSPPLPIPPER